MKKEILNRRTFLKLTGVTAAIPTSLITAKRLTTEQGPTLTPIKPSLPTEPRLLECSDNLDFTNPIPLRMARDYAIEYFQKEKTFHIILTRIPQYRFMRANVSCLIGVMGEPYTVTLTHNGGIQFDKDEIIDFGSYRT
jgi:hypothetical protein